MGEVTGGNSQAELLAELSHVIADRQNDLGRLLDALGMPRGRYMPMSPKDVFEAALALAADLQARLDAVTAERDAAHASGILVGMEMAARAYEAHDKTDLCWIAGSLYDALNREGVGRVRSARAALVKEGV